MRRSSLVLLFLTWLAAPSRAVELEALGNILVNGSGIFKSSVAVGAMAAPAAFSGYGVFYFDSTANKLRLAENGGSFWNMLPSGTANYLPKFAAAPNILADSKIYDNGTNIGIGDTSPASLFTVGSGDLFQVNASGNIVKINNVTYSWPAAQGGTSTVLQNNGSGTLTWAASSGDNLGNHTATQALDLAGFNIVNASSIAVASGKPGLTVSTSVFISTGVLAIGEKTFFTEWNGDSWWSANAKLENGGWNRIDTGKTAFAWSMLGNNNYPYETEQGVGLWVAQSAANPINPIYGAVGGWELGLTLMSNKNLVVGGFGIELDGNGILPYMRVVHNNSLGTINSGIVTNLFADYSGRENNAQPSWYFGRVNDSFQVRRLEGNASIADVNLTPLMVISSSGVVLGSATYTGAPLAALEVISTGTAHTEMAQIWRNGGGVIVGSMSATGVLQAVKFIGDGSGLTGIASGPSKAVVQAADTGITLTSADFGKTITVNSASAQIVYLPSVSSADIGATFRVIKLGAGKVTIDAADSDTIADSGAGDTVFNNAANPRFASITLVLVTDTSWAITDGLGAWITTD